MNPIRVYIDALVDTVVFTGRHAPEAVGAMGIAFLGVSLAFGPFIAWVYIAEVYQPGSITGLLLGFAVMVALYLFVSGPLLVMLSRQLD